MRSARANNAAFEDEERGWVTQTSRLAGSLVRKEKTRFHCDELGTRSAATDTFHVCPECSRTRHGIARNLAARASDKPGVGSSTPHERLEPRPKISGDRSSLAGADHPAIELAYGNQLARGASEKRLIRSVHVITVENGLVDAISGLHGQLDNSVSSHALENAGIGRWSPDVTILHNEDVLAGALSHRARTVQH